ncbi:MAG: 2-phosphosulfolactate phosphatase [Vulcanimicrobiaceae bacterium]
MTETIDVVHFPAGVAAASRSDSIVVIDVLRSTTVIAHALQNGAREVIPATTVGEALEIAKRIGRDSVVLGGEDGNARLPGFDAGNSPSAYTPSLVANKSVVVRTTNGTQALRALDGPTARARVLCGSFANVTRVAKALAEHAGPRVTLLCCGQDGEFSLEDFLCAGAIVHALQHLLPELHTSDAAIAAQSLYEAHDEALYELVARGNHSKDLIDMAFVDDVAACCETNTCDVVPVYRGGSITGA